MAEPLSTGAGKLATEIGTAAARYGARRAVEWAAGIPQERALRGVIAEARKATARALEPGDRARRDHLATLLADLCGPGPFVEALIAAALGGAPSADDVRGLVRLAAVDLDPTTLPQDLPATIDTLARRLADGLRDHASEPASALTPLLELARLDTLVAAVTAPALPEPEQLAAYAALQAERAYARLAADGIHAGRSALEPAWRRFVDAPPWDERVETALREIEDAVAGTRTDGPLDAVRRICAGIDLEDEYRVIVGRLARLRQLEPALSAEAQRSGTARRVLAAVEGLLAPPRFARCLLVAGSSGEGKTHVIAERLRRAADAPDGWIVLALGRPRSGSSVRELLREAAEEATGRPWRRWDELAAYVDEQRQWLVVTVDGLDGWAERDAEHVAALEEEVARSSRYVSVRWLLTADLIRLERLIGQRPFWTEYGWVDPSAPAGATIDGWHVLDSLNLEERTGIRILRALHPDDATPALVALADGDEPEVAGPVRRLSVPFTAWLTHEVSKVLHEPLEPLLDISSLALLARFHETLVGRVERQDACTPDQFRVVLARAADAVAREPAAELDLGRLIEAVASDAGGSSVRDRRTIEQGLEQAMRVGLLAYAPGRDPFAPEATVRPRYEFVWEWLIAGRLVRRCGGAEALRTDRLVAELAGLPDPQRRERVTELALLMADDAAAPTRSPAWEPALETPGLPEHAVWLAAARARAQTQRELVDLAQRAPGDVMTRRTTFALLHFLGDAGLSAPDTALRALSRFYADIGSQRLGGYLEFLVARVLRGVGDRATLLACVRSLVGSEAAARPIELGRIANAALWRVVPEPGEAIDEALALLRHAGAVTEPETAPNRDPLGCFHFCFVHEFTESTCARGGAEAYEWLRERGWYDGERLTIADHVAHRMRTEANTSLGAWYRSTGDDAYPDLVARLVGRGRTGARIADPRDRSNAIYLMLHSIPMHARAHPRIDERFHPFLADVRADPDPLVRAEIRRQHRLFDVNLDPVPDRRRRRRSARG